MANQSSSNLKPMTASRCPIPGSGLKSFRTYQLAVQFYQIVMQQKLPYHLRDQLLRASSSIALNLAEGSGKPSAKEKRRFYSIAMGSLRECQAILDLGNRDSSEAAELADQLGAHLYRLIQASV